MNESFVSQGHSPVEGEHTPHSTRQMKGVRGVTDKIDGQTLQAREGEDEGLERTMGTTKRVNPIESMSKKCLNVSMSCMIMHLLYE